MSSPENYPSPEVEVALLRSDLDELFQTHAHMAGIYQPSDWEQPVEVVIGGICKYTNIHGEAIELGVHVRQRIIDTGADYLVITNTREGGDAQWFQVNSISATNIYQDGEEHLNSSQAAILRLYIDSDKTEWTVDATEACMYDKDLYSRAHDYAKHQDDLQ